ncbi:insulinase family protein [Nodosilinea sp. LEGE 07088]|uniref:M16 family metallopeptidase n=1 Tax=Nodosilinea sp. LEGE 07088 TaxID=2777968 RepID=UPI0018827355|nr:pitrilysin family protein [Nodosilinea sp. LEGE 07088]MBE9137273.1 insulinase family protein [Nodosilinea sp. LEGE 07088]
MSWFNRRRSLMSWLILAIATLTAVIGLSWQPAAIANTARHYTELEFGPLGEIQFPDYERYELANGLVVYLMEDHELPLVSGSATFRTGSRFEPASQVGLASVTGDAMRLGGTTTVSPDELNQALEQRAASVETSIDIDSGTASFSALTEDLASVFALFADVVERPAFAPDKIDFLKNQYAGSIARRNDDPDDITSREFRKLVYGADSPYARVIEYATVKTIDQTSVREFYRASVRPDRTILGIVGDFDREQMKALIEQHFGSWQASGNPLDVTTLPEVTQAKTGVFNVEQPQLTQSYIQIGHLGGQLNSPDHAPLSVLNEVLNGFSGRLFNEIRSRQGLAYVVYAYWAPRYDFPGMFIGGGQTRSDATVPMIESVKGEIQRVRSAPISEAELNQAKDAVLNSFVFNFQRPSQSLERLIRYEYYGYPQDFVFQFQAAVEQTTAAEVLTAAQENIDPDQLVILVVGNSKAIEPGLNALAPDTTVTSLDITIAPAES